MHLIIGLCTLSMYIRRYRPQWGARTRKLGGAQSPTTSFSANSNKMKKHNEGNVSNGYSDK